MLRGRLLGFSIRRKRGDVLREKGRCAKGKVGEREKLLRLLSLSQNLA